MSGNSGFLYDATTYTYFNYPGATSTQAWGINDSGTIAGYYYDVNNDIHSYLYDGTTFTPIDDFPGITGTQVLDINNDGVIVGGYYVGSGRNSSRSSWLTFYATPTVIPEPVSSVLFITGAGVMGFRRFLKRGRK